MGEEGRWSLHRGLRQLFDIGLELGEVVRTVAVAEVV